MNGIFSEYRNIQVNQSKYMLDKNEDYEGISCLPPWRCRPRVLRSLLFEDQFNCQLKCDAYRSNKQTHKHMNEIEHTKKRLYVKFEQLAATHFAANITFRGKTYLSALLLCCSLEVVSRTQ